MIRYDISVAARHSHHFDITLTVDDPHAQQTLSLPVWIPGSYMVREFGRHLSEIQARQGRTLLEVEQLDKTTWRVHGEPGRPLEVRYRVYAMDHSVRCAWLDDQRGFFNGTGLCLRVHDREHCPHHIQLHDLPDHWSVATAMPTSDCAAQGTFEAPDYDALVDHPFELGPFWRGQFTACGVPHDIVVAGALPDFDGERLLRDAQTVCEAQIRFWHPEGPPPFSHYVFLINAVDKGYGGLEHRASTALLIPRKDLPSRPRRSESPEPASEGYLDLLGLISHEYFHTWNVKRLRPAQLVPLDYTRENYTELLWFFEGFTSYYDEHFLLRTGLINPETYQRMMLKGLNQVLAWPGRQVQSVAQASFDAWVKYYRQDENTPNATINYYTKGALVALCLDLHLRETSTHTLDDLMRLLWRRHAEGGVREADILLALSDLAGLETAHLLRSWVHSKGDLPLDEAFARVGITLTDCPPSLAEQMGLKMAEGSLRIQQTFSGGWAQAQGLSAGDEILAVGDWRVQQLEDIPRRVQAGQATAWLCVRDGRLITRSLHWPAAGEVHAQVARRVQWTVRSDVPEPVLARRLAWWAQAAAPGASA